MCDNKQLNILWISANRFGYELLRETVASNLVAIKAIITLSPKSSIIMYDGIEGKKWGAFGIDVLEVERLSEEGNLIRRLSPELIIVCGWREVIDKRILAIPPKGCIGFHPSLLPKGRGPAPIINSILHGFRESGVTMFYLTEHLDSGDIIGQERFNIEESDHAQQVYNKVIEAGKKLTRKYLPLIVQDRAPRVPQHNSKTTIFKKPSIKDNQINIGQESIKGMYRKIKALSKPYKGAYIRKGQKKLIIWRAELKE